MNNKNVLSATLYVILFVSLFILIQSLSFKGGKELVSLLGGTEAADGDYLTKNGETLAITAVISSLATLILFIATKWAPVSGNYLKTRPWAVLMWSALIALGSILPLQFLAEKINLTMPAGTEEMFESIMKVSWGYVALGMMVPIAEEIVFRGAILRVLQKRIRRTQTMDSHCHFSPHLRYYPFQFSTGFTRFFGRSAIGLALFENG